MLVSPMIATRSPGLSPIAASPSETSRARRASSAHETSCHRPSRFSFTAVPSARAFACASNSATRLRAGAPFLSSASAIMCSS